MHFIPAETCFRYSYGTLQSYKKNKINEERDANVLDNGTSHSQASDTGANSSPLLLKVCVATSLQHQYNHGHNHLHYQCNIFSVSSVSLSLVAQAAYKRHTLQHTGLAKGERRTVIL